MNPRTIPKRANNWQARLLATLALMSCVGMPAAMAADFYVATNGNDSNPGTQASPWRTIRRAGSALSAGDRVIVSAGVYSGQVTVANSGSAENNRVVFEAAVGQSVVVDAGMSGHGFYLLGKNYVTIRGFEIRNAAPAGVLTDFNSSYVVVENCYIHHIDSSSQGDNTGGIRFDGCDNCVARNNVIYDVRVMGTYTQFANGSNSAGIHSFRGSNLRIENNEISRAYNGVYHKQSAGIKGAIIQRNIIRDVTRGTYYSVAGAGDPRHFDQELYENIFYRVTQAVFADPYDADTISRTFRIYNNVFDTDPKDEHGTISIAGFEDVRIRDNIFYVGSQDRSITTFRPSGAPLGWHIAESDRNIFYPVARFATNMYSGQAESTSLSAWQQNTNFDSNSFAADPQFVDRANRNYRLQPGSPGAGTGSIPGENIGAYRLGNEVIGPNRPRPNRPALTVQ